MIIAIHQPNYLPWAGYFHKMSLSDRFVLLDNVPFSKNSYQNRCKLKTRAGEAWLTVPVRTAECFAQSTNSVELDGFEWTRKHWATIEQHYKRAAYFGFVESALRCVFEREWELLADMCIDLIERVRAALQIAVPLVRSSSLAVEGHRSELLAAICKELQATEYLSGPSGRNYLDLDVFRRAGIKVSFHSFQPPLYPQMHGDFIPGMSILDLLANCGPRSREYLLAPPIFAKESA